MKVLISLIWLLPIGGACLATVILVLGFPTAGSAPQEAVVAALACAVVVIPYCLARGISEMLHTWIEAAGETVHDTADPNRP